MAAENKTVGIITVHDSTNCGALLQAFALQRTIEKMGFSVEIIDHNRFVENKKDADQRIISRRKKTSLNVLFTQAKGLPAIKIDSPLKKKACDKFIRDHLNISNRRYTETDEIIDDPPIYDCYICGSDQIWNPERFQASSPFFLSFAPENALKVSYAPSLGVSDIPATLQDDYRELVNRLDFVSVREEKGAAVISEITKREVECVLDPTFLIEKDEWISLSTKEKRLVEDDYVFCYFLNYMSAYRIKNELNEYASKHNLKILIFQAKCAGVDSSWIPAYGLGPAEFLEAINHAKMVITDSFHGTALSIKLEKSFYIYSAESDLPFASRFDRISNILKKCLLYDRILDIGLPILDREIDYSRVRAQLNLEIEKSLGFLKNALSFVPEKGHGTNTFRLPYDKDSCYGCGLCSMVCSHNAIKMKMDNEGFYRPDYHEDLCVRCGLCEKKCVALQTPVLQEGSLKKCYAAWNKSISQQESSSSGGIFPALADYVLKSGGIVVGATLSSDMVVQHISIERIEDLRKCQGSKYCQSSLDGIISTIDEALQQNRAVLFTGTGCQAAAIRAYFGDRKKLLLCDVVCHGVGSPGIFSDYIDQIQQNKNKRIINYCFRDESLGWNRPCVRVEFEDGSVDKHRWYKDKYILAFSKNKILRSSCFQCQYSSYPRVSDITIADFWGAKKVGAIYNKKGTSMVVINSRKGKELFESVKDGLRYQEVTFDNAVKYNHSAVSSTTKPNDRDTLFYYYRKQGYEYISRKYLNVPTLTQKLSRKLLRYVGR